MRESDERTVDAALVDLGGPVYERGWAEDVAREAFQARAAAFDRMNAAIARHQSRRWYRRLARWIGTRYGGLPPTRWHRRHKLDDYL